MKHRIFIHWVIGAALIVFGCAQEDGLVSPQLTETEPAILAKVGTSTSDVIEFATGNVKGSSTLLRTKNGVSMTLQTTGLEPGGAYTVWAIFQEADGSVSVLWATGHVVGSNGVGNFAAHIQEGRPPGLVIFGNPDGLVDAETAFVAFIVRTHGQPIPMQLVNQIKTFSGGCVQNECEDVQIAVHLP